MIRRSTVRSAVVASTALLALTVTAGTALAHGTVPPEGSPGPEGLSVIETLGLFLLLPLAIFAVISLAVLGPSMGKGARHRSGEGLESGPVWVGAEGTLDTPVLGDPGTDAPPAGERGGASGRW